MVAKIVYVAFMISIVCNICQFFQSGSQICKDEIKIHHRKLTAVDNIASQKGTAQVINGVEVPAGTRKIFIDLGANDGSSTSFFLSSDAGGNKAIQGGVKGSVMEGLGSTGDWEVVMVEANTNHTKKLDMLKEKAMAQHLAKSITVLNGTAIAKTTGPITFIIDNPKSGAAGATTMAESTSAVGPHFSIPAIGIIDLFHSLNIRHTDFVVLKMDIEGAEFEILRHMITHGLHTRVDVLAVEFHDAAYWVFGKDPKTREKYTAYHKCLNWMVEDIKSMNVVHWGR